MIVKLTLKYLTLEKEKEKESWKLTPIIFKKKLKTVIWKEMPKWPLFPTFLLMFWKESYLYQQDLWNDYSFISGSGGGGVTNRLIEILGCVFNYFVIFISVLPKGVTFDCLEPTYWRQITRSSIRRRSNLYLKFSEAKVGK